MTRRPYNGKYPHRIRTVWSDGKAGVCIQSNDGLKWRIIPVTAKGKANMPKPGIEIWEYVTTNDYKGEAV